MNRNRFFSLMLYLITLGTLFSYLAPYAVAASMQDPDVSDKNNGPRIENPFYVRQAFFAFRPKHDRNSSIDRFGPVGIGIDLIKPAFTMIVRNIESGSPADKTRKLKKGQIIDSINGQKLSAIDPRIQLGDIIYHAEAKDGKVTFVMRDKPSARPKTVVVNIPKLGSYSATWPLNCKKSDKIVSDLPII